MDDSGKRNGENKINGFFKKDSFFFVCFKENKV